MLPNVSKMDLPRLLNDIPKYKPWVSDPNWKHWETFVRNSDQPKGVVWDLHRLVSVAIQSSSRAGAPVPISQELQRLLAKESTAPPQVKHAKLLATLV